MKKLIIMFIVAMTAIGVHAQGFQSEVRVGYDLGVDSYKNNSFGAEYIAAYRVNPMFRIGAGVGVNYVDLFFDDASVSVTNHNVHVYDEYSESAVSIPLFINAKVNFIDNKITPYFSADLGYNYYIACSDYAKENDLGLFVAPALGIDFRNAKGAFTLQVGYRYQVRTCNYWADTNGNYSQLCLKLGYQF